MFLNMFARSSADLARENSFTGILLKSPSSLVFICLMNSSSCLAIFLGSSNGAIFFMPELSNVAAVSPFLSVSAKIGLLARRYSYNLAGIW